MARNRPFACRTPVFPAVIPPDGCISVNRSSRPANSLAITGPASLDPSSTMSTSRLRMVWRASESRQAARCASALRKGTTTLSLGGLVRGDTSGSEMGISVGGLEDPVEHAGGGAAVVVRAVPGGEGGARVPEPGVERGGLPQDLDDLPRGAQQRPGGLRVEVEVETAHVVAVALQVVGEEDHR